MKTLNFENLFVYLFYFTTELSHWDFSNGKFGLLSRAMPAATESRYPTHGACWVFLRFHNPLNSDMDCRIFNVRTDVNACSCTWGCMDTIRESALKVDSGRKIPYRTRESNLRQRRAGPMLYQLSYILALLYIRPSLEGEPSNLHTQRNFQTYICI